MTTPVRTLGTAATAGYTVLGDSDVTYRDGAEDAVLALVQATADRSSTSEEMVRRARGWAQRYHSDPMRANVLRALRLPAAARVLEIGAGSGIISRYLGETCALVDTIEPMAARAAAAAARCADQDNVAVFVGELADVPAEPTYDVVVVIGVLEYVGGGSLDLTAKRAFLAQIAERLTDGGTLILAIENRLGVKYLVGAPEDHTRGIYESIEGYRRRGRALTLSRRGLADLLADVGLTGEILGAFPDYKLTRAVFGELPAAAASLAWRVPQFPSPDWMGTRPRGADERAVWRELVEAGVGADFANSLVAVVSKGPAGHTVWPSGRGGVFYSGARRPQFVTQTVIETGPGPGEVMLRRTPLVTGAASGIDGPVRLATTDAPYVAGRDLPDVIADGGLEVAGPYLTAWTKLVRDAVARGDGSAFDLVPHNLIVRPDNTLAVIDIELLLPGVTVDEVLRRGVYGLAKELARLAPPERWSGCATVGDLAAALGELVGLGSPGGSGTDTSWLDEFVAAEAAVQAQVRDRRPADMDDDAWTERVAAGIRKQLALRLTSLPLGTRLQDTHEELTARLTRLDRELAKVKRQLTKARTTAPAKRPLARRVAGRLRRIAGRVKRRLRGTA